MNATTLRAYLYNMNWGIDTGKNKIEQLGTAIKEADAVVVGAGAGLSTSAGYTYSGLRFHKYFGDFSAKYGFGDMYSGGFAVMQLRPEELWGFWSRNIYINRYMAPPKRTYEKLLELLDDKDFFVITTNVDHCFQRAGIDKRRLFYTQGDYGLWQCQGGRIKKTYDNEVAVKKMLLAQGFWFEHVRSANGAIVEKDSACDDLDYGADWGDLLPPEGEYGKTDFSKLSMAIPRELLPVCPDDGSPMVMNLRADDSFVEDEGWHEASLRYSEFLRTHMNGKVLFLDLGSGGNTPVIFKIPFMSWTRDWPSALYATINKGEAFTAREIADKSIVIDDDIDKVIEEVATWVRS
ncbi:MAG: hypothetical protein IJH43_00490 [Mogibacterium sp.]|nr:hypothetical protein [Mogibacterium sp.]